MTRKFDTFPRPVGVLGLLTAAVGTVPVLSAAGVIPSDDADFGAPRWIVALIAFSFVAVGAMLAVLSLPSWTPAIAPDAVWVRRTAAFFGVLLLVAFFGGVGAFLNWKAFVSGGGGTAEVTVGGIAIPLPPFLRNVAERLGVTIFALIFDAIALASVWELVKTRLRPPPMGPGATKP